MNFLHPKSLSEKLFWLQCDDVCWIQLRMYTVKLMHFQLAVLDSFIFLTKEKGKYWNWKLFLLRPSPLLFIIISVHIFPLVYPYSYILKSVQHYVKAFWLWRCWFCGRKVLICVLNSIITCNAFLKRSSPVLNSHNNFQKDKLYSSKKSKFWTKFFLDTGSLASKLGQNLQFFKILPFWKPYRFW